MSINGYVPRMTTIKALLSSRDPAPADAIRGSHGTRPAERDAMGRHRIQFSRQSGIVTEDPY